MATIRKRMDRWQVQVRRQGQRSLTKTFGLRKDAEAWARHIEVQADRNELPQSKHDPKLLDGVTLGDLVRRYIDEVCSKKRSYAVEQVVLEAFLRHPLCKKPVLQITTRDFAAYRDERLQSIKSNTLGRQLTPIRHLFEVAKTDWDLPIRDNPVASLCLEKGDTARERRLRAGEWDRLVEAARTRKNPNVLPVMRFALATAMRRGEILGMQWDHLDGDNRSLLIPQTKNGHARIIPLSQEALSILEYGSCNSSSVFPISANAFRLSWQRIKTIAEVDDLRFHDLRHEAISRFFEMGLSVPEVALISGHRDARMLFRYTHPMVQAVGAKLDNM